MSIQNALKVIKDIRESKNKASKISTMEDLVILSDTKGLPCSENDLEAAFQIDWKMRWVKHSNKF